MNLLIALVSIGLAGAAAPGEIIPGELLVLPPAPRAGRPGAAADPVQAAIIAGRWSPPKVGEIVAIPDGPARAWQAIKPDKDGTFRHPALRGGYAFASIGSDGDAVMILEAAGHSMGYAGGEPRAGDPYSHGYVRVPVGLKAGENPLLFVAGRGSLRLKLTRPRAEAQIDPGDPTLPDLIVGRGAKEWAAVVVANASTRTLEGASLRAEVDGAGVVTPLPTIPPLGVRKVPFRLEAPAASAEGKRDLKLALMLKGRDAPIDSATLTLDVVRPDRAQKRTFVSGIDGSVQYFGLVPAASGKGDRKPGLILTLHGASVEGIGQARVYKPKDWAHVVAPTNRRPYGFDWEEWGRLDAIEVLDLATRQLDPDPRRVYLTGHSMGGHGTWHVGVTFPDRFAAIAPSAGWVSLFSYGGRRRPEGTADPVAALVARAQSPSDTLALIRNLGPKGVYILHGDKDDNVPVDQARTMRRALGEFHPDFAYYERPDAGHWWGDECCDWPPLLDFLARHELPAAGDVRKIDFATAAPGVSSRAHWASVEAQIKPFSRSAIHLDADPSARTISGTTENVARLALDLGRFKPGGPFKVTLDGDTVDGLDRRQGLAGARGGEVEADRPPLAGAQGAGAIGPVPRRVPQPRPARLRDARHGRGERLGAGEGPVRRGDVLVSRQRVDGRRPRRRVRPPGRARPQRRPLRERRHERRLVGPARRRPGPGRAGLGPFRRDDDRGRRPRLPVRPAEAGERPGGRRGRRGDGPGRDAAGRPAAVFRVGRGVSRPDSHRRRGGRRGRLLRGRLGRGVGRVRPAESP